jgi:hypothetical protein
MVALERRERGECLVRAAEMALRDGDRQQGIAVIGGLPEQRRARLERFAELMLPDECPQPLDVGGGGCRCRRA